ncbi:MAG: ABC transporter ATP-binding protein [Clostridia bacterium]
MNVLEFKNVSKTFYTKTSQTQAIKDLSFTIKEGEFVALLGPSGCGKTTILSLICGILPQSEGEILINGEPAHISSKVGYMLQHDHLFEWRNIYKNVILGLEIQKKLQKENTAHAVSLLDKYGLTEFSNHYPNQLSGGMRQRVALIRTLATNPQILLLDEPFSALDFQTRLKVCDDVYSIIKKEGKTTLLVTHDISEAISMADRIIVLTARPATIKQEHLTLMQDVSTPLLRREHKDFSKQFETIWQELNV